jgi:hypothetical protein
MASSIVRVACGLSIVAMTWLLALGLAPWRWQTVGWLLVWALLAGALALKLPAAKESA